MNKSKWEQFNQYYEQSLLTEDTFASSVAAYYTLTGTATASFANNQMTVTNTGFVGREYIPVSNTFLKVHVSSMSSIQMRVLGKLITIATDGTYTLEGQTGKVLPSYSPGSMVRLYVKTFSNMIHLLINYNNAYYTMYTNVTSPSYTPIGFGPATYSYIKIRAIKSCFALHILGGDLAGEVPDVVQSRILEKNVMLFNHTYPNSGIVDIASSQASTANSNFVVGAKNVVYAILDQVSVNTANAADYMTHISSLLRNTMSFVLWISTITPTNMTIKATIADINQQLLALPVKNIDITSRVIDSTGVQVVDPQKETIDKLFIAMYDEMDTFLTVNKLVSEQVETTATKIATPQGTNLQSNLYSMYSSNHLGVSGTIFLSSTSGAPASNGVRPNGSALVLDPKSTVDIAIGRGTDSLWFSTPTSGIVSIYNGLTPVWTQSASLTNFATDALFQTAATFNQPLVCGTRSTYAAPSVGTQSTGTLVVLKSNQSSVASDCSVGIDAAQHLWLNCLNQLDLYANASRFANFGATGNTLSSSMTLTGTSTFMTLSHGIYNYKTAANADGSMTMTHTNASGTKTLVTVSDANIATMGIPIVFQKATSIAQLSSNIWSVNAQAGILELTGLTSTSNYTSPLSFTFYNQFITATSLIMLTPIQLTVQGSGFFLLFRVYGIHPAGGSCMIEVSTTGGTVNLSDSPKLQFLIL